ncbi:MAG: enoyl-CoA hydratase/isomerase family protein [Pseudomonadota bacterium]|jgi:enoyl-CoA hydratase/carnithine racemase|nr:enoyl-CoA hydratase/isomerase family protein [Pseudomonadota bacterium]MEC8492801.1 enoyl-CoA hydratase/isomerase family protein [Pseudomonadota bacterium]
MTYDYQLLTVGITGRIATVTIDNPPINIITPQLYLELVGLVAQLKDDDRLSVVVFKSADPDFFIAHYDVENILKFPTDGDAERNLELSDFHTMCERLRTMNKVTIAQIEGRVGGGGSELAASMDMRFGVIDKTVINQMEVPLGILPGGSGTQRLPRLVGRGRAMEIVLGADDLDAQTAERWGYLNRIYDADQINAKVAALAKRIARFPVEAVRLAKASVNASDLPIQQGLQEEAYLFARLLRSQAAQHNMSQFLQIGGQTREGELRVSELSAQLGKTD